VYAMVQRQAEPDRFPAIFDEDVLARWKSWHDSTPTCLKQIPPAQRLEGKPVAMPQKCLPPESNPDRKPEREQAQVELIAYANPDGGRVLTSAELQRNAQATLRRVFTTKDLFEGQVVALKKESPGEDEDTPVPGEGTPFFLATILKVEVVEEGASDVPPSVSNGPSSSSASLPMPEAQPPKQVAQPVRRILVHYMMPFSGKQDRPSDDVKKPWKCTCICRQPWTEAHSRAKSCLRRLEKLPENSDPVKEKTTKYVDWLSPEHIMEANLPLNATGTLTKLSKDSLLSHCSDGTDWGLR
jgi:hypothetical protein